MFRASVRLVAMLSVISLFDAASADAAVLYQDSFSRTGDLNGLTPDTTTGSATWAAATPWATDGSQANVSSNLAQAFLPLSVQPGAVYTLSLDLACTGTTLGEDDWMAYGFTNANKTDAAGFHNDTVKPYGWGLVRNSLYTGTDFAYTVMGPGLGGIVETAGADSNPHTYSVVLDTRPTAWTTEFKVDGVSVRGPVAFATNPVINFVGIGGVGGTGWVDNFQVTGPVPMPEPGTLCLLFTGLLGLLCYAWRKQK
jgi:hypothetical protein